MAERIMQNIQPLCLINAIRQAFNTGEAPEQLAGQVNNRSNDAGELPIPPLIHW